MNYLRTKAKKVDKVLKDKLLSKEISEFHYLVYDFVKTVPKGKTATYKEVAVAIGHPKAYRAVGNALNKNPQIGVIPCHRVVRSNGQAGGFALGAHKKIQLLKNELSSIASRRG